MEALFWHCGFYNAFRFHQFDAGIPEVSENNNFRMKIVLTFSANHPLKRRTLFLIYEVDKGEYELG